MRANKIRNDYSLFEAFQACGEHIFGSAWDGNEAKLTKKPLAPVSTVEEWVGAETALEKSRQTNSDIQAQLNETTNRLKRSELKAMLEQEIQNASNIIRRMQNLDDPNGQEWREWARWERRERVEGHMITTLEKGDLVAYSMFGMGIDRDLWAGRAGFAYCFQLSLVKLPKGRSSERLHAIYFEQTPFENWLNTIPSDAPENQKPPNKEDLCAEFIKRLKTENDTQPKKRELIFEDALAVIPGLSERAFLRQWSRFAGDWKKRGRRKWKD